MKNKLVFTFSTLLIIGFVFIGCDTGEGEEDGNDNEPYLSVYITLDPPKQMTSPNNVSITADDGIIELRVNAVFADETGSGQMVVDGSGGNLGCTLQWYKNGNLLSVNESLLKINVSGEGNIDTTVSNGDIIKVVGSYGGFTDEYQITFLVVQ
jgi:hypothetical protein